MRAGAYFVNFVSPGTDALVYADVINASFTDPASVQALFKRSVYHELFHAFTEGPDDDNCGFQAIDGKKCVMTYDFYPSLVPDGHGGYIIEPSLPSGTSLCPFHLDLLRTSIDKP